MKKCYVHVDTHVLSALLHNVNDNLFQLTRKVKETWAVNNGKAHHKIDVRVKVVYPLRPSPPDPFSIIGFIGMFAVTNYANIWLASLTNHC